MAELNQARENPALITSNQNDIDKLAGESGISLGGKFGGRLLLLFSQIAIARILGPALFGVFSIGITIFKLVQIFGPLGLNNGVIWFGSKYNKIDSPKLRGIVLQTILLSLISGGIFAILFFAGAPLIARIYGFPDLSTVIRLIAVTLIFAVALRVAAASTRISQHVKYSVISEDLLQPFLYLSLVLLLYLIGFKLVGALLANLISFVVSLLFSGYFIYRLFFRFKDISIQFSIPNKMVLVYSLPTAFVGLLGAANYWIDRLIIGFLRPAYEVGYYNAASQISMLFVIILSSTATIFAPMIANLHHQGEKKRVSEVYRISTKWGLYLGLPAFILILFFPQEIISIFGQSYVAGAVSLIILSFGQIVNLSTGNVGFLLVMTGNQNAWLKISFISLIINIILNIVFTSWFGVIGTAISTTISVILMYEAGVYYAQRRLNIWPYDKRMLKGIIGAACVVGFGLVLEMFNISAGKLTWIVAGFVFYIIFFGTLYFVGLEKEDIEILNLIRAKVFG
jgi:O-antigen/teichoic acid export membrane protein